ETAQAMNKVFAEREVYKRYLCVTRGFTAEEGFIDHPIKEKLDKLADKHANPDKPPQEAQTAYKRLGTVELEMPVGRYASARYSLVAVEPHTGRKHQIRRHMKHISHPLVGDTKHGDGRHNDAFRERYQLERLLLMATDLRFVHPRNGEVLHFQAAVDDYCKNLFDQFGWQGLYPA
ncbi:MAG: pseudouridine synthase, partial [Pontibacterium sp.]